MDITNLTICVLMGGIGLGLCGYMFRKRINTVRYRIQNKLIRMALPYIITEVNNGLASQTPVDLTINRSSGLAKLTYERLGNTATIYLPYDKQLVRTSRNYEVRATINGVETMIKQPPGIPFMVTGNQIGATRISVHNLSNNEHTSLRLDEIIHYP